jgi:hypothetical protein
MDFFGNWPSFFYRKENSTEKAKLIVINEYFEGEFNTDRRENDKLSKKSNL